MSTIKNQTKPFDPNGPGIKNGNFIGLPFDQESARLILLSIPWDVTTSYQGGTSRGPDNILEASYQLDLHHELYGRAWEQGIYFSPSDPYLLELNDSTRLLASNYIAALESEEDMTSPKWTQDLRQVNANCEIMIARTQAALETLLDKNKMIGLLGGDHSCPLGYYRVLDKRHEEWGILQIDAHMDLRQAYEGFLYSHASIFYNAVTELKNLKSLIQVGIRDFCEEEWEFADQNKVQVFTAYTIDQESFQGVSWSQHCQKIISLLPPKVHISVDIDGLDPAYCPHTGTPVPGGISYNQLMYLIDTVKRANKTIIGFDICETAPPPHDYDGNVAARVAYTLSLAMLSQ